jgi:hypothetical protein
MKHSHEQLPKKRSVRPQVADKIGFWLSTHRDVDGLWVGTMESAPHPGLRRVEDALRLIKHYGPLHYSRVLHHLERVWINLTSHGDACYERSLEACVLDERFVLAETTTTERIATVIVHEATHARLEHRGIAYDEKIRTRIEAICSRRELAFAIKLPDSEQLQEEIARSLEFYGPNTEYFSDASFHNRRIQGEIEALRHLGTPDWLIRAVLKVRSVISTVRNRVSRLASRDVLRFGTKDPNS